MTANVQGVTRRLAAARTVLVLLLAPVGLLTGHAVTYRLAIPDAAARADDLHGTGHQWMGPGWQIAIAVAALGVLWALVSSAPHRHQTPHRLHWTAAVALQVGAFVVLEIGEHIVSGHAGPELRLLALGAAVQLGVAALQVLLAVATDEVARLVRPRTVSTAGRPTVEPTPLRSIRLSQVILRRSPTRGPPIRLVTH